MQTQPTYAEVKAALNEFWNANGNEVAAKWMENSATELARVMNRRNVRPMTVIATAILVGVIAERNGWPLIEIKET